MIGKLLPPLLFLVAMALSLIARHLRFRREYPDPERRAAAVARKRLVQRYANTALVVAVPLGVVVFVLEPNSFRLNVVVYVGAAFIPVAIFLQYLHDSRLKQRILAEEFRVCAKCLYSLKGSPDTGRCPECGYGYTLQSLKEDWSKTLRLDRSEKQQGFLLIFWAIGNILYMFIAVALFYISYQTMEVVRDSPVSAPVLRNASFITAGVGVAIVLALVVSWWRFVINYRKYASNRSARREGR